MDPTTRLDHQLHEELVRLAWEEARALRGQRPEDLRCRAIYWPSHRRRDGFTSLVQALPPEVWRPSVSKVLARHAIFAYLVMVGGPLPYMVYESLLGGGSIRFILRDGLLSLPQPEAFPGEPLLSSAGLPPGPPGLS